MTTLLSREQVYMVRGARKAAAVLLVMLLIDRLHPGRSTRADEIAPILEMDERTVKGHLESLCVSNTAIFDGRGYVLTEGRALLLGMDQALPQDMALSEANELASQQAHVALALNAPQTLQKNTQTLCAPLLDLKKIEEEDLFKLKSSSSSEFKSAKNAQSLRGLQAGNEEAWAIANLEAGETVPQVVGLVDENGNSIYKMQCLDGFITTREILEATEILEGFGDIAPGLPVDAIKPEIALGWVAKAYDDRDRLSNPPAALVYSRLRGLERQRPPQRYMNSAIQFLPDEYAKALRLSKYDCKSCVDAGFSTRTEYNAHVQEMHTEKDTELEAALSKLRSMQGQGVEDDDEIVADESLAPMWKTVLDKMKNELPRAGYDTWLRDTVALFVRGEVLTVGVRNAYARDWLTSRLQDAIESHVGMQVSFVVAEMAQE